jgi:hypothetical protein
MTNYQNQILESCACMFVESQHLTITYPLAKAVPGILLLIGTLITLTACNKPVPVPVAGPFVPSDQLEIRPPMFTTESLTNCGNNAVKIQVSRGATTNHEIEWKVGVTAGVGFKIDPKVIPGGVDLQGALGSDLVHKMILSRTFTKQWELSAKPQTEVSYKLKWCEVWQHGYVEVRAENRSIQVQVSFLTNIQTNIESQEEKPCGVVAQGTQTVPLPVESLATKSISEDSAIVTDDETTDETDDETTDETDGETTDETDGETTDETDDETTDEELVCEKTRHYLLGVAA